ncbi:MAG: restriction endonuclease [Alphaproteobacteria bacterium]
MNKNLSTKKDLQKIIDAYDSVVKGIDAKAKENEDRAYGGIIRADKGSLVESIAHDLVKIAWREIGGQLNDISLEKKFIKIPIQQNYIDKIKSNEVKDYIKNNINNFYYSLKMDVHVSIKSKLKLAIECKSYTENAMLKRILVDFTLLKQIHPDTKFILLQLESQLGGDYGTKNLIKLGSPSTHTLLSYFDIDLNIITLLEGERKIDKPIHKKDFYKALEYKDLENALKTIKDLLK